VWEFAFKNNAVVLVYIRIFSFMMHACIYRFTISCSSTICMCFCFSEISFFVIACVDDVTGVYKLNSSAEMGLH
jgi:hypothetical protein